MQIVFNPLTGMFDIVGTGTSGGGTLLDTNTHLIRELLVVEDNAILSVSSPAIVWITDGNSGRSLTIRNGSTADYA